MHPICAFGVVLPDELVEVAVGLNPLEPTLAFRLVAIDAEVCCLALHVLTVADAADGSVQSRTSVAGAYLDFMPHRGAERLEYVMHQPTKVYDLCLSGLVADAACLGGGRGTEFLEGEVLTDACHCHGCVVVCRCRD